jgi:hypothetical protein
VGKPIEDLIRIKFDASYLTIEDNKRFIYHHVNVDIRPLLKRDDTIYPSYELTVFKGIPLNE